MEPRSRIDAFGATSLVGFSFVLAVNQVVIHLMNEGVQPVFFAGVRSALAAAVIAAVMLAQGRSPRLERAVLGPGLLIGLLFAAEFVCLFLALDLTGVTRVSVIFYSMPVWLSLMAHFLLPGERMGALKALGLALAFAGVAWAILSREGASAGEGSLAGDLLALGAAWGWAGVALCARATRLRAARPETQLLWQVAVSAPVLLLLAPLFGPALREPEAWHLAGGAFQVALASVGFLFWFRLLSIYPASGVASFSFLAPVFGVGLGWLLLGESVGPPLLGAAALVAVGLVLVNRPAGAPAAIPLPPDPVAVPLPPEPKPPQVPQKVAATTSSGAGGRA